MKHTAPPVHCVEVSVQNRSCDRATTARDATSFSNVFPHAQHQELLSRGRAFDPHRYRVMFPERWMAFLRAHHRSIEEVAVFYDVTSRTATYWWEGTHRPSGDKVALAATAHPAGFHKFMGSAA